MRKAFKFIKPEEVETPVYDNVGAFVPEQSLSLRQIMMQFAYIGNDKLQEIVNRGFDGDEDDDLLGVDVGALDFAEVHDRMVEMLGNKPAARVVHVEPVSADAAPVVTDAAPADAE